MDWFDLVGDLVAALPAKWALVVVVLAVVALVIWVVTQDG